MFRPRVIPVLLLQEERLVKTTRFQDPIYVGDPINTVRLFKEMGADELLLLDITAGKANRCINPVFVERLSEETAMPLGVGGGISSLHDMEYLIRSGAEKIVLSTALFTQPNLLKQAVKEFGSSTISVCLDVLETNNTYTFSTRYPQHGVNSSVLDFAKQLEAEGAGELILQLENRDGTLAGYDENLLSLVVPQLSIPVVALGGANSQAQMKHLHENLAVNGFGAGRLFTFLGSSVLISYESFRY